jgi:hypothetical protein
MKKKLTDVCSGLFDIVEKPKNYYSCRAINVFDNKYRINVYVREEVDGLIRQTIKDSYFASVDNGKLNILYPSGCTI